MLIKLQNLLSMHCLLATMFKMEEFLKNLTLHAVLQIVIIQLLPFSSQGWGKLQGCNYNNSGYADCDFQKWTPPLMDNEFGAEPVFHLELYNINGTIPAGAFSGLNGPLTNINVYMEFRCNYGRMNLSRDIFTPNLHWLKRLVIVGCYIENGLPSRLLEHLKSLQHLYIHGTDSVIEGFVAHDALAGLTNLRTILVNAIVTNGRLPPGFFDDLRNLIAINLQYANLDFIPPEWFNGLLSLRYIDLRNNNLRTLPPGLFDGLSSLKYLRLDNNPWMCSCGLMWLLDWPHITGRYGVICQSPSVVRNMKLEDAFGLLDCTASTSVDISTTVSSATETTRTQTAPVTTVTGLETYMRTKCVEPLKKQRATVTLLMESIIETSSQKKWIASTFISAMSMTLTDSMIPISFTVTSTATSPTTSTDEAGTMLNVSPFPPTKSTFIQTFNFIATRKSVSDTRETSIDGTVNILDYAIVISVAGAVLTVLLLVTAILYRCVCWNKYAGGLNRVNIGEDARNGPYSESSRYFRSSVTQIPPTNTRIIGSRFKNPFCDRAYRNQNFMLTDYKLEKSNF